MFNTCSEIEAYFRVNTQGRIEDPGKFEGEPRYAPYFWDAVMLGCSAQEDTDGTLVLDVSEEDRVEFPELANVAQVCLMSDNAGFLYAVPRVASPAYA